MNLTRRIFASLIPAAPAAVAAQRSGLGSTLRDEVRAPTPHPQDVNWIGKTAQEIIYPSNWNQFREAEQKLQDVERYRRDYHEFCRYRQLDPNIESLKSVSRQHKIHMQIKQQQEQEKARRTWYDELVAQFGLTEFMKKREASYGNESGPAASASDW